ncbi:MAG TPA: ABC transporter substrate-binding protein [Candidatus Lambdaproteobacteria bacterium]|nr:ABC transporter substrate-binding protein [SAR324 cluster bacterium]HHZ78474.1 ABC transporter substrate-binding protein [Candidatus Lambdaproteobacteria bacterium]HIB46559.1 ABC transporter substrate-binding protein [Candidatus Lambdaproteobacteria bacterium]HIO10154.1 ABC transporter substrate-binding protein [Deltaproteobacteria bacterium]HIO61679.1 ABC transporter substrate-binding protein [Deltaproteobacteria bacterium]
MQDVIKTIINGLLISLLCFSFGATSLFADEVSEIRAMTKEKVDLVIRTLKDSSLSKEEKKQGILKTIDGLFDFSLMARLSLGKKHWKSLSKSGRKEFSKLFVERLKQSYLDKLDLYTDEEVVVDEAKMTKKNRVEVVTYLVSKDDKKEMTYKLYKTKKKGWMVYDVDVLGVSIVQTYRSQFSGILKKESLEQLMERLRSARKLGS